jgi:hypothetical protein
MLFGYQLFMVVPMVKEIIAHDQIFIAVTKSQYRDIEFSFDMS